MIAGVTGPDRRAALALILGIWLVLLSPASALAAGSPSSGSSPSSAASPSSSSSPSSAALTPNPAGGALGALPPATTPATPTQTQQPVTPVVTTSSPGGSVSGIDALLVAIGAIVVLAIIAYFIWSDSRRHARLLHRRTAASGGPTGGNRSGSKAPAKSRKLKPAERRRRKRGRAPTRR